MKSFLIFLNLATFFLLSNISLAQKIDLKTAKNSSEKNQYEKAVEKCKKEIEKDPQNPKLHYNLGMLYGLLDQHENALDEFKKAVLLFTDDKDKVKCWESIGWECYLLGRYEESTEYTKKALEVDSTRTLIKFNLGLAKLAKGDFEGALNTYEKALKDKKNPKILEGVIKDLFILLEEKKNLPEVHFILASIFHFQNLDYSAFSQLKDYLFKSPDGIWQNIALQKIDSLESFLNKKGLDAVVTLNSYLSSLKDSTKKIALEYWNEKERKRFRNGDEIFDLRAKWLGNSESLEYYKFQNDFKNNIIGWYPISFEEEKDYVKIELKIIDKRYQPFPFIYYLVEEKNRMVLCNPYITFSKGWERKSSLHFDFFIKPGQRVLKRKIDEAENLYNNLCELYNVSFENPIEVYVCSTGEEINKLSYLGRWGGVNFAPGELIFMIGPQINALTHEFVHIVQYKFMKRFTGSFFSEGFAVCYGGCGDLSEKATLSRVKQLLLSKEIPHLNVLLANKARIHPNNFYPIAGSFIRFLIDEYGIEKLKILFEKYDSKISLWDSILIEIYGLSVSDIEKDWHSYILDLTIPEIELRINKKAKKIFSYDDPEGDDYGDGDYIYPDSKLFQSGVCDILNFKVFEDSDRFYFQVKLKNILANDTLSDFGFYGPIISIFIAKKGKYKPPYYYDLLEKNGLSLSKDYSYWMINCSGGGVEFWEDGEVLACLKRDVYEQSLVDFQENTIQFSVPKSLLGNFQKDWKFGLACGCHKGSLKDYFGVGTYSKIKKLKNFEIGEKATDPELSPNVYDILVPKGEDQKEILSGYGEKKGKYVVLPLIGQ